MNTVIYDEVLNAEIQDLFPEVFDEGIYSIPLEPKQLVSILKALKKIEDTETYSYLISFLNEENLNLIL